MTTYHSEQVTDATFHEWIERVRACSDPVVDTETTGLMPYNGDSLVGVAVLIGDRAGYFPFAHSPDLFCPSGNLSEGRLAGLLRALEGKRLIGYNTKFDLHFLCAAGMRPPPCIVDVMVGLHLVDENAPSFALKAQADRLLGEGSGEEDALKQMLGGDKGKIHTLPASAVYKYACQDVILTQRLRDFVPNDLGGLWEEYNDYCLCLFQMERAGLPVSEEQVCKAGTGLRLDLFIRQKMLDAAVGRHINAMSAAQLTRVFGTAKHMELSTLRQPGAEDAAVIKRIHKLLGAYYAPLTKYSSGGVIHANFNPAGTISGRLSCSRPINLQAIPRNGEHRVRDVVVAPAGYKILEMDYAQAEIRVATHYAKCKGMHEILRSGGDMHSKTASQTGLDRDTAKRLNFAVIYGVGAAKLAATNGMSEPAAKRILEQYHASFPEFRQLYYDAERVARSRGHIVLFSGRRRHFVDDEMTPYHKASSNLVQGAVAEMLRLVLVKVMRAGVDVRLSVHDSLLAVVPGGAVAEVAALMNTAALDHSWCTAPLACDFKCGDSWGSAQKIKP